MIGNIVYKSFYKLRDIGIKIYRNYFSNDFSADEALIITGSPRSGTTWLSDIFSSPPGYSAILEPLHLNNVEVQKLGFSWRQFIPPNEQRNDVKEYFNKVFTGKIANGYNTIDTPFLKILGTKHWVVKFVRANRLLPWLVENFRFKYKPVLIIRHPCGVIYSQMKHPLFPPPKGIENFNLELIQRFFPQFKNVIEKVKREEEIRALTWSLDNFIPFHYYSPDKWILVFYEELVLNGFNVLKKIYSEWGMSVPIEAIYQLRKRSREARGWAKFDKKGRKKLGTWKKYLSREQISSILSIVHEFGFVGYTENIEPDYNNLFQE